MGARNNVADMENDAFYQFIQKTYPIHPIMMAIALYALGGFPYIVWGMVRLYTGQFAPFFVFSSCSHIEEQHLILEC